MDFAAQICPACALEATAGGQHGRVGAYALEEIIGRGGMGTVFLATHEKTGHVVAVKVPSFNDDSSGELRRRFATEVEVLTALDHPGILRIYEVGETDGTPYYTMKLAEGSLAEVLATWQADPRHAAEQLVTIAEAVHHAHQHGILHRDLKPQNILLDEAGRPLVADFGLARWLARETSQTAGEGMLGTPDYLAPEVAAGGARAATVASDVFSLGALLYHGLAGKPPFHGDSVIETLARLAQGEPRPIRPANPRVPDDLERICRKCLERSPAARYASAAALAADLRAWREGRPLLVRSQTWTERGWRLARRNPIVTSLSILLLLAILGGGTGMWISQQHSLAAERARADAAERLAAERLAAQRIAEAGQLIRTGRTGQRTRTLALLREAWAARPGVEIRTLAIQALSLADLTEAPGGTGSAALTSPAPVPAAIPAPVSGRTARVDEERRLRIENAQGGIEAGGNFSGRVCALSWHPAGDRLVVATDDKCLHLWNAGSPEIPLRLNTRESQTRLLAWHPTKPLVACLTEDGVLRLWDSVSGDDAVASQRLFPANAPLSWSADGQTILCGPERVAVSFPRILRLYRPAHDEPSLEDLRTVSLSPDNRRAAVASEAGASVWDLQTGWPVAHLKKNRNEWLGVRLTADGALAAGWNSLLRHLPWTALQGELPSTAGVPLATYDGSTLAELSANERWAGLINSTDRCFYVRSIAESGDEKATPARPPAAGPPITLPQPQPYWITFSADGRMAATSSYQEAQIKLWSLPVGELQREITFYRASRLDLSSDGRRLLATRGNGATEYDTATGTVLRVLTADAELRRAAYSPDGQWIVLATAQAVHLFRRDTGELLARLSIPAPHPGERLRTLAFSQNGLLLAGQFANGTLALWDLAEIERALREQGMAW